MKSEIVIDCEDEVLRSQLEIVIADVVWKNCIKFEGMEGKTFQFTTKIIFDKVKITEDVGSCS